MAPKKAAAKDKDAPKKPRTAYILFSQETRADVKAEEPDLKSPDVMKELGRRWRELDEAGRQPFHDMAEKDKKRHRKEQAEYDAKKLGKAAPAPQDDDASEEEEEEEEDE